MESKKGRAQGFRHVGSKAAIEQRTKRHPMTATVLKSGRCLFNRTAVAGVEEIAVGKGLTNGYHLVLEVNEEAEVIGVHEVPVETPDSARPRILANGELSFSVDLALDEMPKLRPGKRVKCSVAILKDDQGQPFLGINLGAQLEQAKRPLQAAAGKQA